MSGRFKGFFFFFGIHQALTLFGSVILIFLQHQINWDI